MGITGLLPFLKKCSRPANLSEFKGLTAAIDAYCWLHKGAFSCADKLVKGEPTMGYVLYVMKQINVLLSFNIKPILVFDGCHLPSKASTEAKRRENREKNRAKAKELLRQGRDREARECFQRCVDITSEMARNVIEACRERNVDIIVAPYEADAQLAFLNREKIADLVITEDSDLILFGCDKVLFKMDNNGGGSLVESDKLYMSMSLPRDKFTFEKFLYMCILSGCDYLPSLHGIGLGKACKFFSLITNPDVHSVLCRLPSYLKMPSLEVTQEYRDNFMKAINTFKYQLVFDPARRELVPLTTYPIGVTAEEFPYAGRHVGHERGLQIALGNINVQTGETVDYYDPDTAKLKKPKSSQWKQKGDIITSHPSIWKSNYTNGWSIKTKVLESKVPVLNIINNNNHNNTLGKVKMVSSTNIKRKIETVDDDKDTHMTDGHLQQMYGALCKKHKYNNDVDSHKVDEAEVVNNSLLDKSVEEEEAVKENKSPVSQSRNPFVKKSSTSDLAKNSNTYTAFKNLNQIETTVSTNTIVQSRFFGSLNPNSSPRLVKEETPEKEDSTDSEPEDSSIISKLNESNNSESSNNTLKSRFTFKKINSDSTLSSPVSNVKALPLFNKKLSPNLYKVSSHTTVLLDKNTEDDMKDSNDNTLESLINPVQDESSFLENGISSPQSNNISQATLDLDSLSPKNSSSVENNISSTQSKTNNSLNKLSSFTKKSPNNVMKRKTLPSTKCGRIGLSKSSTKQLTLKDMFSFTRKK